MVIVNSMVAAIRMTSDKGGLSRLFLASIALLVTLGCYHIPASLECDRVLFSSLGDGRGFAFRASYGPEEFDKNRKGVGEGALFVKLNNGPPIRFRDLKPDDVLTLPSTTSRREIDDGKEQLKVIWYGATYFRFRDDRLVDALIAETSSKFTFCDKSGTKEFSLPHRIYSIADKLGQENCFVQ
jgi:hypothetical protein